MGKAPGDNPSAPGQAMVVDGDRQEIRHHPAARPTTRKKSQLNRRVFVLAHDAARRAATRAIEEAPEGYVVEVRPRTRNLEQNAKFHAICSDMARAGAEWAGKARTAEQWKVLLVSGHSVATQGSAEIIPGIEGEFVNIRESTALMSKARAASLISYATAYCADKGIPLREREWEWGDDGVS